jgi:hypothetical protein
MVHRPDFSQSAIFVNVEIWISFYMRVSNHYESPLLLLHLLVHPVHLLFGETSCIKGKIPGLTGVVYVHPQNINLEFMQGEISVTLDYCFGSQLVLPLTEVETEAISRWHLYVAR